jgi:DNA/RNA endonuclease YhcR with UshA esterase domain
VNRIIRAGVLLVLAVSVLAATPTHIPVAAARQRAVGDTVTVIGLVTVPSGRFRSSSEDEGFALADRTGGIWISTATNLRLREGQRVLVTGPLAVRARKLQIVPTDVQRLPGRELTVATGQVGAATLGRLITIEGTITRTVSDPPYGHKVFLDDGSGEVQVFLNASTDIDPTAAHLQPGRNLRVTGFGTQYESTYEVEPRSRRDIRRLSRPVSAP